FDVSFAVPGVVEVSGVGVGECPAGEHAVGVVVGGGALFDAGVVCGGGVVAGEVGVCPCACVAGWCVPEYGSAGERDGDVGDGVRGVEGERSGVAGDGGAVEFAFDDVVGGVAGVADLGGGGPGDDSGEERGGVGVEVRGVGGVVQPGRSSCGGGAGDHLGAGLVAVHGGFGAVGGHRCGNDGVAVRLAPSDIDAWRRDRGVSGCETGAELVSGT